MSTVLVLGLAALFASIVLAFVAGGVLARRTDDGVERSLAAVAALSTTRPPGAAGGEETDLRRAELAVPVAERVVEPLVRHFVGLGRRMHPEERIGSLRRRLDLAGNPAGWDPDRVMGLKALGLVVGLTLGLLLPPLLGAGPLPTTGIGVAGAGIGWFGPQLWLYQLAYDRGESIRRDLPDALDLMTISVEAGLAFDAALWQVATRTRGPLAREFYRVLQEIRLGTGRAEAMRALADRTEVGELRGFLSAMVQADEFGVPIAGVLRVQAGEMRLKRSQRAEELAQKVPVKILFPLIFCIMPCLFIVVLGPAAISVMQNFQVWGL